MGRDTRVLFFRRLLLMGIFLSIVSYLAAQSEHITSPTIKHARDTNHSISVNAATNHSLSIDTAKHTPSLLKDATIRPLSVWVDTVRSSLSTPATHSPTKAVILSAILPGAGQVYNRQAWKIPIVYAGLGAMTYVVYNTYIQMKDYKDEYLYRVNHDGATQNTSYANLPTTNIYNLYQSYNKNFQLYIFIDIAVYALNLVDAFVFAHLFDFNIDDNLSLHVSPTLTPLMRNTGVSALSGLSFTLRF